MKRKQVLELLRAGGVPTDNVTFHRDGTVTVKRSFFYRGGLTSQKIAEKIEKAIPGAIILEAREDWKVWPKTSYFVVVFRLEEMV